MFLLNFNTNYSLCLSVFFFPWNKCIYYHAVVFFPFSRMLDYLLISVHYFISFFSYFTFIIYSFFCFGSNLILSFVLQPALKIQYVHCRSFTYHSERKIGFFNRIPTVQNRNQFF